MGSGKSAIGRELSEVTSSTFIDLDDFIEQKEGKSISELFHQKGEIYFRKKEAEYLNELLGLQPNLVLATGGGTPCYGNIMKDLLKCSDAVTVYLNCSVSTLTDRLWLEREQRPLIQHLQTKELLNDFIRKHLFERSFYYNQASIKVLCDGLSVEEILEQIVLKLL